ncbi:MAG: barstar family protein [Alphaproteobacteria bacterium]|nr:barstar family protein [Alphaproteobacteria bacterium]
MTVGDFAFNFIDDLSAIDTHDAFVVRIGKEITSESQLLNYLSESFKFPGYFGFNWNALYDCLCDFHWISSYKIILIHENLPDISSDNLKIYLKILQDSVRSWHESDIHIFEIFFKSNILFDM